MTESKPKEPTLNDIGTRYTHLNDHYEALEAIITSMLTRPHLGPAEKGVLIKLRNAADVIKSTIDSYAGLGSSSAEFALYRLVNSVPDKPELIEGGRGTPLC